jgi:hypothetical protein
MVGSPNGSLTHHGGNPVVSKLHEGKAMGFESPGGLDTGEKAQEADPLEQQVQGARPQGASWKNAWVLKPQGLKAWLGAGIGDINCGCLQVA